MKSLKFLFITLLFGFFVSVMSVSAYTEQALFCKELIKRNGTSVFYGPTGEVLASEQDFINQCQQTCVVEPEEIEKYDYYYDRYRQQNNPDILYCVDPQKGYASRGCFAGASIQIFAAYKSTAWMDNLTDDELKSYVSSHPDKVYEAIDKTTGEKILWIEDLSYDKDEVKTYRDILLGYTTRICGVLKNKAGFRSDGEVNLSYATVWRDLAGQLNSKLTPVSYNLTAVKQALQRKHALLVSIKGTPSNPSHFTTSTHYISIVAYDEATNRYLVMHSGGVNPSGWYSADIINNELTHHRGNGNMWEFVPDECYDKVYEVEGTDSCTCDVVTGEYKYTRYNPDGSIADIDIWSQEDEDFQDKMNQYQGKGCPSSCSSNVCKIEGSQHYCKDGQPCDTNKFYKECCDLIDPDSEEYKLYCDCGDADINFIGACTEFNSDNEYLMNHVADTPDDAKLKYCLFNPNNQDKADNSYEMTDQTSVANNPYCKVSCIEDYEFKLPNSQYTLSGSYFTLETEVKGTRKCYVNGRDGYNGIDKEKFLQDLLEASQELVAAQNEYNELSTVFYEDENGLEPYIRVRTEVGCEDNTIYSNKAYYRKSCTVSRNGDNISVSCNNRERVEEGRWKVGSASDNDCCDENGKNCCCENGENGSYDDFVKAVLGTKTVDGEKVTKTLDDYEAVITEKTAKVNKILQQYDDCTNGWVNQFHFDPLVQFEYDEPYQNMNGFNNRFEQVSKATDSRTDYCQNVGDDYKCDNQNYQTYNQSYVVCGNGECTTATKAFSSSLYVVKSQSAHATYKPKNGFSIYTPAGTIALDRGNYVLYTGLCDGTEECLPIALNTHTGVFNFKFRFSQIGQFNDNNQVGRLVGQDKSVYNAVSNQQEAGYVCHYVNNCPECDYVCVGDSCNIDQDGCTDNCTYICQNCIFDGESSTFYYRTVSINKLFPNERQYGPNWNNEKGNYTKQKIEEDGEEIYKEPEYSYTINAQQMNRIREFNRSVGDYLNSKMPNGEDALACHDLSSNGRNYQNIYCISAFLDTAGNTYFTENKRNDIWTLWPDSGYFRDNTRYSVVLGIGPAWK